MCFPIIHIAIFFEFQSWLKQCSSVRNYVCWCLDSWIHQVRLWYQNLHICAEVHVPNRIWSLVNQNRTILSCNQGCIYKHRIATLRQANCLVPDCLEPAGNNPIHEPILTQICVMIWHHLSTIPQWVDFVYTLQTINSHRGVCIYIYSKWTVFVNVTTKSAQHWMRRWLLLLLKKSKLKSFVQPWFHGCNNN